MEGLHGIGIGSVQSMWWNEEPCHVKCGSYLLYFDMNLFAVEVAGGGRGGGGGGGWNEIANTLEQMTIRSH